MHLLISFIVNALALWVVTQLHVGVHADSLPALLLAAIVFGIVNAIVRPVLLILSIPFIVLTLGLFVFIVNGLALWLVGALVPGFHVYGLWAGVVGSIILGIVSWIVNALGLRLEAAA